MADETTPLLNGGGGSMNGNSSTSIANSHGHFCALIGIPSSDEPHKRSVRLSPKTLYGRAVHRHKIQNYSYNITAAVSNLLLFAQVVLGATLTALGASESSHILITIFGVFNTIIAGVVAYLKSRGQPMRARVFRDDLENVVDEIENSEAMWRGVAQCALGYNELDLEDKVSVRSEIARLTRLYECAVKKYMTSNPDLYNATNGVVEPGAGLRPRPRPESQLPNGAAGSESGAGGTMTGANGPPSEDEDDDDPTTTENLSKNAHDHSKRKSGNGGQGSTAPDKKESKISAPDAEPAVAS